MLLLDIVETKVEACIDACIKCAQACNKCFKACLEKDNINDMKEALALLVDCAEICYVTASYLSKDDIFSEDICKACAELCEKCAETCQAYEDLHCQASVKVCRHCAAVCRSMYGKL